MEFGVHLPLISFTGEQRSLDDLIADHESRERSRLHARLRERPSRVLAPVARRADGAGCRARAQRSDDARDDGRRAGAPWTGGDREDPRGDRPAVRRPTAGRARSRLVGPGLRAGRRELRGALEAVGRGGADPACVLARRRRRVRGHVLLHRRLHASANACSTSRSTDLDRELGIGSRAETRGAPCRRLARLRLQHDPGAVRPGAGWTSRQSWRHAGAMRRCSRTASQRCGVTSPRTGLAPKRCSPTCWRRCSIARWNGSARSFPSVRRRNLQRSWLAYERAGAQRVFLWPLADERAQLEMFRERVVPLIDGQRNVT